MTQSSVVVSRDRCAIGLLVLVSLLAVPMHAEEATEPVRPKYVPPFRDREDWSQFDAADFANDPDLFDPIKHIHLSEDESIWASFGGQWRLRFEAWNNFGGADARDAEELLLSRFRFHGDLHIGPNVRIFAEGLSALSTDTTFRVDGLLDVNEITLQQLFADVTLPASDDLKFTLRSGRQELAFGKQRLVSPLDWSNTRRKWDGFRLTTKAGTWTIDAFATQFVPVDKYQFDRPEEQIPFWGVYATGPLHGDTSLDLYYLGLDMQSKFAGAGPGGSDLGEIRHTMGGRLFGKVADTGFDYDLEGAYQFGDSRGTDIAAHMLATEVGYAFANWGGKPRLFTGVDYASGDDKADDNELNTFNQLFPLGHAYLGMIDAIGRQNTMSYNVGLGFEPVKKVTATISGHYFRLADENDVLYNVGGAPVAGASGVKEVGYELDILLNYQHDAHTNIQVGYSHLFGGDYFEVAGMDDIDFFYVSWQYTF